MATYRAYRLKNDHITKPPNIIVADDDQDAIKQAEQLVDGHDIELWEGRRLVRAFKAEGEATRGKASDFVRRQKVIDDLKE